MPLRLIFGLILTVFLAFGQSLFPKNIKSFDPRVERAVMGPDGPQIIPVPSVLKELKKLPAIEREALGAFFASQGLPVDVQIDIWGWDAVKTMKYRAGYGYTWVHPLYSVTVAPGLYVPSLPPYDPKKAPVGAILVPPEKLLP